MTLLQAAKAVVDRWDTFLWKDVPATAELINDLRKALEEAKKQKPVGWMYVNEDGECEQIEYGLVFDDPGVRPLYISPQQNDNEEERKAIVNAKSKVFAEINDKEIQMKVIIEEGTVTTILSNIPYEKVNIIYVNLDRDYNFIEEKSRASMYEVDELFKYNVH